MSVELHVDQGAARPERALQAVPDTEPPDRTHPNVSGDLPMVLQAGPMFRRAVAGYDRFQVDTYVRWAEDELAAADREREHLLARSHRTEVALEEARELLAHSSGGGEFLRSSRRIGSLLAAAADEAENIRAEAENHRSVACAQAEVIAAGARRVLADAEAEAERLAARAATEADELIAEAGRLVAEAEGTLATSRAEAAARLDEVRAIEQRAAEDAARIRARAEEESVAARLRARDEVVRMLGTAREERRRADDEAAAVRNRLDRDATGRRTAVLRELAALEQRRALLRAEVELLASAPVAPHGGRLTVRLRRVLERLGPPSLRAR